MPIRPGLNFANGGEHLHWWTSISGHPRDAANHHAEHQMTIELHAFDTPNGRKISVALEEMALPYTVKVVDIRKGDQREPEFLKISPNAKIPAIVDSEGPDGKPVSVFESGAILIYLGEKTGKFRPSSLAARIPVLEWLMFQHGGFGPIPGQVHHFLASTTKAIAATGSSDTRRKPGGSTASWTVGWKRANFSLTYYRSRTSRFSAGHGAIRGTRSTSPTSRASSGGMTR